MSIHPAGSSVDRLRADIDSGRTSDKVAGSDPAAAPLGSDDEAAGTPPSSGSVEHTRRQEIKAAGHPSGEDRPRIGAAWLLIGFCGVLAGAIIIWYAVQVW